MIKLQDWEFVKQKKKHYVFTLFELVTYFLLKFVAEIIIRIQTRDRTKTFLNNRSQFTHFFLPQESTNSKEENKEILRFERKK